MTKMTLVSTISLFYGANPEWEIVDCSSVLPLNHNFVLCIPKNQLNICKQNYQILSGIMKYFREVLY
jgi:hypothetical protein